MAAFWQRASLLLVSQTRVRIHSYLEPVSTVLQVLLRLGPNMLFSLEFKVWLLLVTSDTVDDCYRFISQRPIPGTYPNSPTHSSISAPANELIQPAEHFIVPVQAVTRFQHPMILIGENYQSTWYVFLLKSIESP